MKMRTILIIVIRLFEQKVEINKILPLTRIAKYVIKEHINNVVHVG